MHRRKTEISPSSMGVSEMTDYRNLEHARYAPHRKKIGLHARFSKGNENLQQDFFIKRSSFQDYVKENFKRKECVRFVPKKNPKAKPGEQDKCHCGEVLEKHIKWTSGAQEYFQKGMAVTENDISTGEAGQTWSAETDIREFTTNAFGKIDFINEGIGGYKPAKFVRMADTTDIEKVIGLMMQQWHMGQPHEPNLIITVIGGAKNFKLDGKKKDIFNEGLVAAAQTTHAWIITSGCNMGVMKAVGEAVAEGQTYNWDRFGMSHTLRCIGIAPWGYVERNEVLVSRDAQGMWNASYKVSNLIKHLHPVSLNGNHTHFMLIDDGYRGRYGGVADFRAKLEKKFCSPVNEGGMGKHVVLVVVEGGTDAIKDVSRSLKQKIPVVLCEGTGRAADILAYAYNHFVTLRKGERKISKKHETIIEDLLVRAYGKTWEERSSIEKEQAIYLDLVLECCQDEKLITVFDMNKNEDLDLAILSALLKGQGATEADQLLDQLTLALTWNRSDVAEEKIFNKDINWPQGKLDDIMTRALVEDKVNFVKLLLSNGVVMREYLTVERLRYLYNTAPKSGNLFYLLKPIARSDRFTLSDVGKLLRILIGKHDDETYRSDNDINITHKKQDESGTKTFEKPFRELFLWAVLMNRQELARFLWERGDEAIPSAIAASKIYEEMADKLAHYDHDLKEVYIQNKQEFEQWALKVLDESHFTDPDKAAMLIERKYATWGGMTCLELASSANDKEFLSSVACQNSLNISWKRGVESPWWQVLLSIFFPPLVLCVIRFEDLGDSKEGIHGCAKLLTFFRAPMTKFAGNVIMYFFFLLLYSYVILFDFRNPMQITEYVVLVWILSMAMEEIREMIFLSESDSLRERLKVWWNFSVFNRIDLLIIIVAVIGLILRLIPGYLSEGKTAYCINCILLFVRALSFYSASSYLGPKLVMISRMMQELMLYIAILVVFLLAYGVSSQSLQYPTRTFTVSIFKDIFYYPYWQIYGELFLEELEGRTSECLADNTTGVLMSDGNPCPTYSWLVPALTAGYLLIGNVLLINLLIAIFTHVFEEIEQNSIQIWKFGMYFLVVEYDVKPGLPPPFVLFEHVFLIFRWIFRKTCCKPEHGGLNMAESQMLILDIFEKECQKQYFRKRRIIDEFSMQRRINTIGHRVDEVAKLLEEDRMLEHQHIEAEMSKPKGGSNHDSPKHITVVKTPKTPRGSSIDLRKLVAKSEEEERRQQWNLNVINPAPAEMALEAKPPMFDDKDIGETTLLVPLSPNHFSPPTHPPSFTMSPRLEQKISNLAQQRQVEEDNQDAGNKTDVDNTAVVQDDGIYNRLDHQKLRKPETDSDYGTVGLMKQYQKGRSEDESDSEDEQSRRKHRKKGGKKRRDTRDEELDQPKGKFLYETLDGGKYAGSHSSTKLSLRTSTPPPPPSPPSHRAVPRQESLGSELEDRIAKVEANTQNQLSNIETLLKSLALQREESVSDNNTGIQKGGGRKREEERNESARGPAQPSQQNILQPTARVAAYGGPLGGFPQPGVYPTYGYPNQPNPYHHQQQQNLMYGVPPQASSQHPQQPLYASVPFQHSSPPQTRRDGKERGAGSRAKSADGRSSTTQGQARNEHLGAVLPRFGYMDSNI